MRAEKALVRAMVAVVLISNLAIMGMWLVNAQDINPPTVKWSSPQAGSTSESTRTLVPIEFSEPMDHASVEKAFSLTSGSMPVDGSFNWSGKYCYFIPSEPLKFDTNYTIYVSTEAKDIASNAMNKPFSSQFTTMPANEPPIVVTVIPAKGATDASVESPEIQISFSKPMNDSSVQHAFSLSNGKTAVNGSTSMSFDIHGHDCLLFTPSAQLEYSTNYTISVSDEAKDANGMALESPFSSWFTTQPVANITPYVVSVSPSNATTNVSTDATVSVTFSKPMDDNSVRSGFTLSVAGTPVKGSLNASQANTQYVFTPASPLQYATNYSISVSVATKDLEGNNMTSEFVSNFITQAASDSTAPIISDTTPNSAITLYTNGSSAKQTIGASYSDNVGVSVATVSMDGKNVTKAWGVNTSSFHYNASLTSGNHTIILTVTDAAGFEARSIWNINVIKDTRAPIVSGYTNGQNITDTSVVPTIGATFSDNIGVNAAKTIITIDGKDVTSSATVSDTGFTYPTDPLNGGNHTIGITIQDLAGNSATVSWKVQVSNGTAAENPPATNSSI